VGILITWYGGKTKDRDWTAEGHRILKFPMQTCGHLRCLVLSIRHAFVFFLQSLLADVRRTAIK